MTLRLLQGLLLPAIFTALMTYVSARSSGDKVQRAMAIYVASTILGGFLGRATSGAIAAWAGWRFSFLILGVTLLAIGALLGRLPETGGRQALRPGLDQVRRVLRQPGYLHIYFLIFCMFFVFAAVMNFLPFRLTELSSKADDMRIGLMYSGYVMGIVTSLAAVRICRKIGSEKRALLAGTAVFGIALFGLNTPSIPWLFADMFLFCGAMFLVHATSSGLLNRRAEANRGLVNGLYVASYYSGGMIGSYLPGFAYQHFGWTGLIVLLEMLVVLGLVLLARFPMLEEQAPSGNI
ncbi:MAG: MFS transporter [Desulfuromonadales bacterium]